MSVSTKNSLNVQYFPFPKRSPKGVQQLAIQLDETWKAVASRFEKNAELGYLP
ncbi:transposase [Escherichia coli]|nr:transposase [Escherichia coli]